MTCALCFELLKYPVTLQCGHSLCKPCILGFHKGGTSINVVCPTCGAKTHYDREADMVVNQGLQASMDIQRGSRAARIACQRCEETEATVDCEDCNSKFCSACSDLIHKGRLSSHRFVFSEQAVQGLSKAPICDQAGHGDYRLDLYCADCNVLLCVLCSQTTTTHRSHNVIPLHEAAAVEKVKLHSTLDAAGRFRKELREVNKALDVASVDADAQIKRELTQLDDTINSIIAELEGKRRALIDEAQTMHAEEKMKIKRTKEQLLNLASKLNDSVSFCQRAVSNSSHVDVITGRVEMERQLTHHAPIVVPPLHIPTFRLPHLRALQSAIDEISVKSDKATTDVPTAVLEASSIFNQRGFKFCKSTYNEVQLFNRGFSAVSSASTWETVMGDVQMSQGAHYWEIKLDRHDTTNGHNVVIGVVFDGNQELCEVLGEDEHSVGFNCGRGTKCVNGDFFQPYGAPCASGDVIGTKLDFSEGTIEFYKNSVSMGVAFTGLSRAAYAAVSLINNQQVSLMFPLRMPL